MDTAHGVRGFPDGQKQVLAGEEEAEKATEALMEKEVQLTNAVFEAETVKSLYFHKENKYIPAESDTCT